ncbi:MAG: arylsulfotransferase family protein [Gemmatimonadales bacterium]
MTHRYHFPAIVTLLGLAACGDDPVEPDPTPTPTPPLEYVGAEVVPNPNMVVSSIVTATARRYDSAFVRYWSDADIGSVTPTAAFPDTVLSMPVLGLLAGQTYRLEINLVSGDSLVAKADTLEFQSDTLPDWIPRPGTMGVDTTPGFLLLSYPDGPVVVDNEGNVRWYRFMPNGVLNSVQAHANGVYTILGAGDSTGFILLDATGDEVGSIACLGHSTRFHDVLVLAGGDRWMLCNDIRRMDLTQFGGLDTATVVSTVIQHISASEQLLFEWNALDHFALTDAPELLLGGNVNWNHGNSIELDSDGNLLVSFRSLNEVAKIDVVSGDVIWRFGGSQNEFTFVNDPKGSFVRQHGLRRAGPNEIQFLDNGAGPPSRMVRYLIDDTAKTATLVLEFLDGPNTFTVVGGGTQYYANGHGIVTFGRAGRVIEVDAAGNRAWELTGIDGTYVFRTQRLTSLYTPGVGEPTR